MDEQDVNVAVREFADAFDVFSAADVSWWSESSAFAAVSCERPKQGQRCIVLPEEPGLPLEGAPRNFDRIATVGNGACSVNSVFGMPVQHQRFRSGIVCEDAYPRRALTLEAFMHDQDHREAWQDLIHSV